MKVIKAGQLPEHATYSHTCAYCNAEFEYERSEALAVPTGRNETFLKTQCPTCKRDCYNDIERPIRCHPAGAGHQPNPSPVPANPPPRKP